MLRALLPYVRGAGVDTRWAVINQEPEFFVVTKRLHNNLHGDPGDGGPLGPAERRLYEEALAASAAEIANPPRGGDVAYLHDPQTAGLIPAAARPERRRLALPHRRRPSRTTWSGAPGTSSAPTSASPTPTSSPAASTSGKGSRRSAAG